MERTFLYVTFAFRFREILFSMLKKNLSIFVLFFSFSLLGQKEVAKEVSFITSIPKISIGTTEIKDPYLSPFVYQGSHLKFEKSTERFLGKSRKYTFFSDYFISGGAALHPSKNNRMLYFDTQLMLGGKYHFVPFKKFHIALGTGWAVGIGSKYLARNVNNPASLDLQTGLNGVMNLDYSFRIWKVDCRVNYGLTTPLTGVIFVPQQGMTYYEIFSLNNFAKTIHFTSLHNRQAINHSFDFDVRFNKMTIRLGVSQDYRIYRANDMVFKYNGLNISLGTVFNIYRYFGNKQNREVKLVAPDNFWLNKK